MDNSTHMTPNSSKKKSKKQAGPKTSLLGGHSISTAFYESIQQQIEGRMHLVKEGQLYVTRELCGGVFWAGKLTGAWQRQMAGRCFAHMVSKGLFPFTFKQYKKSKTKHYLLKK